jgi:uncharacterized protein YyaL (SSP411 family)
MPNRLGDAISPYLRSHADNPVDWHGWGEEAFAEAKERDVPVLVSIGYSTCHWCHVMARESFSDPEVASFLNERFVSIKVDREEHPDVDASYLAAASAFTPNLGWPLNVFVTPEGRAFYAGTYFPPVPLQGHPSFRQILAAMTTAWENRRDEVSAMAASIADALAGASKLGGGDTTLPDEAALANAVQHLADSEDTTFGGFGDAPKFPASPMLKFLLGRADGGPLALRTLKRMGASPLRDSVEGGFFRYAVNRDWSDPHYERMLYDNAQLLDLYTRAFAMTSEEWAYSVADGIAKFLINVMQLPDGGFASAQDSESIVAGQRTEGGYYALEEEDRAKETPPALDRKVLTGWNGLAIAALARAGFGLARPELVAAARRAADFLLSEHRRDDGTLVRTSIDRRISAAQSTLEDYGMFAGGLLELALVTGEVNYAIAARSLIDSTLAEATRVFRTPNGADPVLASQGMGVDIDPSEGAYPSGLTATAEAAYTLYSVTGERRYLDAAIAGMGLIADLAPSRPLAFGAALRLSGRLVAPTRQLVVVSPRAEASREPGDEQEDDLVDAARREVDGVVASVTAGQSRAFADAGFELFVGREPQSGLATAYFCSDFVCRLPVTDAVSLARAKSKSDEAHRTVH